MSEIPNINDLRVPELHHLEELYEERLVFQGVIENDAFESTKIEAETRYNFRNRLEKEQVIANDSDLQDRVAFLGSTVLGLLKDTQAIRQILPIAEAVEMESTEVAFDAQLTQVVDFYKRYGVKTDKSKEFAERLYIKSGHFIEEDTSWQELLNLHEVKLKLGKHYVHVSDGNLVRYSKVLHHKDTNQEDWRKRALQTVALNENGGGLTSNEIWEKVFGKDKEYDEKVMTSIHEWMAKLTHDGENIIVSSTHHGQETEYGVAPNIDLKIEDSAEITPYKPSSVSPWLEDNLPSMTILAHYLVGFDEVFADYGKKPITTEMLDDMNSYTPDLSDLKTPGEIDRHRELCFRKLTNLMSDENALLEFIDNLIEADIAEAKVVDIIISHFETVNGRNFLRTIMQSRWDTLRTIAADGMPVVKKRNLVANDGQVVWPLKAKTT